MGNPNWAESEQTDHPESTPHHVILCGSQAGGNPGIGSLCAAGILLMTMTGAPEGVYIYMRELIDLSIYIPSCRPIYVFICHVCMRHVCRVRSWVKDSGLRPFRLLGLGTSAYVVEYRFWSGGV